MKIIEITLINFHKYIVVTNSIDKGCRDLLEYLDKEDLYFTKDREIKTVEIIANKVDIDDYENIYEINEKK